MDNVAELQVGPDETSIENEKTSKENEKTSKETDNKIFDILESKPEITVHKIAEALNMSVSGVRYHIEKMKTAGKIEHIGSTKKGKWIVHK